MTAVRVRDLGHEFRLMHLLGSEDIEWLLQVARKYFILNEIAEKDWTRNYIERFTTSLEIEELVRQLEGGKA